MSAATHIYGLIDPRTNELRYVGMSKRPRRRLTFHMCASQLRSKNHRAHWLRGLLAAGARPELVILETVSNDTWQEAEQFWIGYFKFIGANLTNSTEGGEGLSGIGPEGRERCGAARRGKSFVFSDVHKARIAEANRARAADPEWRARMSRVMRGNSNGKGRPKPEKWRVKLGARSSARLMAMTPEQRREFAMCGVRARLERAAA